MKLNKKGFTMVELLVAMAIMGLLVIMAFPTIRAIQINNTNKKYEEYGKSAVSAAKIYADSYAEDLFDSEQDNELKVIYFDELVKKDLIKDINLSDSSCITESSITVVKYKDDYSYCLHLVCKSRNATETDKALYEEKNRLGDCAKFTPRKVNYIYDTTKSRDVVDGDENYSVLSPVTLKFNFNSHHDVFLRWNTKSDGSGKTYNPGDKLDKINGDVNLYAITRKWQYSIHFNSGVADSGTISENPKNCSYGNNCYLPENNLSKVGYTFDGWSDGTNKYADKENVKTKIGNNIPGDGYHVYLTAAFKIKSCTVTYSPNNGKFNSHADSVTQTVNWGSYFGDATDGLRNALGGHYNATRDGFHLEEATAWTDGSNTFDQTKRYLAQDVCDLSDSSNSTTLKANWKKNKVIIRLNANGANFASTYNHAYTKDSNGLISYNGNTDLHTVYYGSTLTNDGLLNYNNPSYLNLVRKGYHIDEKSEWNTAADGSGTPYDQSKVYSAEELCSSITTNSICTKTLYANWKATIYNCSAGTYLKKDTTSCTTCVAGNYCPGGSYKYNPDNDQGIYDCPSGYGNSPAGSNEDKDCYKNVSAGHYVKTAKGSSVACGSGYSSIAHTVNYGSTSNCSINTYTISYDLNGGSVSGNPTSYTIETATFTLNNPTRKGYIFDGWSGTDITGNSKAVKVTKGSKGNRSYTAHWTFDTTRVASLDKNPSIFFLSYRDQKCDTNHTEYQNTDYKNHPFRRYWYNSYLCTCHRNADGVYIGNYSNTSTAVDPPERNIHPDGDMTIFYDDNDNGIHACKNDTNYYINQYISAVCSLNEFTLAGKEKVGNSEYSYGNIHGYRWYDTGPGSGAAFHSLITSGAGWFHTEGKYDDRYRPSSPTNNSDQRKEACNHICDLYW